MGKRGNGEGSIYERADGRWCGQATLDGKRKTIYGKTRREVQQKIRKLLADAERGIMPTRERLTLAAFLDRWLHDSVQTEVRPRTFENYRDLSAWYITPTLGTVKLDDLQPSHLQRLYTTLLIEQGRAPKTVKNVHGILRKALDQAVLWGLAQRNVATLVKAPKVERREAQVLDRVAAKMLLDAAKGTTWHALLATAVGTGLRQGELLGLKWGDIDLDTAQLSVNRQLGRDGQLVAPKTAQGRRRLVLPRFAIQALSAHRVMQQELKEEIGAEYADQGLVFATHQGRPLHYRNVIRAYKGFLIKAGLPPIRFHDLRHTAATLLLGEGVHPKVVQELLGHSDIAITLNTYSHVIPNMGRDAADRMDEALG